MPVAPPTRAATASSLTEDSLIEMVQGLFDGSRMNMDLQMPCGSGCNATISFNPTVTASCWLDEHITRPPAIGLAHEVIHALRNVQGAAALQGQGEAG